MGVNVIFYDRNSDSISYCDGCGMEFEQLDPTWTIKVEHLTLDLCQDCFYEIREKMYAHKG